MSGDILEQDEIDALLHGVDSGAVDTAPKPADDLGVAREYDFSTQTRIVRGRMPTLEMINERLARSLRLSLYSMLRRLAGHRRAGHLHAQVFRIRADAVGADQPEPDPLPCR